METAVLVLLWAVVLWRAPAALRSPKQRTLWVTFTALTLAMTLRTAAVMEAIDSGLGVNNLSTLFKHALGITAAAALLEFVFAMARPASGGLGRRLAVTGAAVATMGVLFVFIPRRTQVADFYESYAGSGPATAYLLVWYLYLGTAMAVATWLFWGAGRHARAGWLRTGLRLLGAGTAAGVGYALARGLYLALRLPGVLDDDNDAVVTTATDVAKHGAIVLILIGSSVPAIGVAWRASRHWLLLRRLYPLWHDLTSVAPEVVLDERLRRRELRLRLHRRVVEIRDAMLALQPYLLTSRRDAAEVIAAEVEEDPVERRALVEACWLEEIRRAKLAGRPVADDVTRRCTEDGEQLDLEAEARWLQRVEAARHHAAVRRFLDASEPSGASQPSGAPARSDVPDLSDNGEAPGTGEAPDTADASVSENASVSGGAAGRTAEAPKRAPKDAPDAPDAPKDTQQETAPQ